MLIMHVGYIRSWTRLHSPGTATRGLVVRVQMTGKNCQATALDAGDAARRSLTWLADDASPARTKIIRSWFWLPGRSGLLGALPRSARRSGAAACRDPGGLAARPGPGPHRRNGPPMRHPAGRAGMVRCELALPVPFAQDGSACPDAQAAGSPSPGTAVPRVSEGRNRSCFRPCQETRERQ